MRQELITLEELKSKLREQGIENIEQVKIAHLEEDGEISIVKNDAEQPDKSSGQSAGKKVY
jgi:uncharacterized membrane protein YcaP (DUF421 family)